MPRNKHLSRKTHGRIIKVSSNPPTWLEIGDETPDDIVRERYKHNLNRQSEFIKNSSKMKDIPFS